MSSSYGKKYVIIPVEEFQRMKQQKVNEISPSIKPYNPEQKDFEKSALKMKGVWDDDGEEGEDKAPEEKIRRYTEELNNIKRRYN